MLSIWYRYSNHMRIWLNAENHLVPGLTNRGTGAKSFLVTSGLCNIQNTAKTLENSRKVWSWVQGWSGRQLPLPVRWGKGGRWVETDDNVVRLIHQFSDLNFCLSSTSRGAYACDLAIERALAAALSQRWPKSAIYSLRWDSYLSVNLGRRMML